MSKPLRHYDHHVVNSVTILSICYHLDILGVFQLFTPAPSPSFQASVLPSCQNHYGIMITILSICYHMAICGACQLFMPDTSPLFQASVLSLLCTGTLSEELDQNLHSVVRIPSCACGLAVHWNIVRGVSLIS